MSTKIVNDLSNQRELKIEEEKNVIYEYAGNN